MNTAVFRSTLLWLRKWQRLLPVAAMLTLLCVLVPVRGTVITYGADPEPLWPDTWILLDEDANDTSQAYRDVLQASCAFDDNYMYLRLGLEAPVDWSTSTRYKWFFGIDGTADLAKSGNIIRNATHLLFVEDTLADGTNEVYILDSGGDGIFSEYEPYQYSSSPGPAGSEVAGWRVVGNNIDLYLSLGQLGLTAPDAGVQLTWATDGVNPNLAQAAGDTPDDADIPLILQTEPSATLTAEPEPVEAGGTLTYAASVMNEGASTMANASGNEFEVVIPANTALVDGSVLVNGAPGAGVAYDVVSRLLTWNGSVAPGGQVEISYQVTVDSPLVNGTTISSQATVWYDSDGDDVSDSSVLSDDPRTGTPGDACLGTVSSAPVLVVAAPERLRSTRPGRTVAYEITIENTGNAPATDLVLDLSLPPELTIAAVEPPPPGGGSTVWTSASLSPLDGAQTIRVSLGVDSRLRRDIDLASVAALTCAEGPTASATTVVPCRVERDDDDDDGDSGRDSTPPPEEEVEPDEPEAPQELLDATPATPRVPTLALGPVPSAPGTASFDIGLQNVPTDGLTSLVYFELPDALAIIDMVMHQGSTYSVDGNRVSIQVPGGLEATTIATLTVGPVGSALEGGQIAGEIDLCPALYAVLHTIDGPVSADGTLVLGLSVLNIGDCPVRDVVARVKLPQHVSVVHAAVEQRGILSVVDNELIAALGTLEVQAGAEATLELVSKEKGFGDSGPTDNPLGSAIPQVALLTG